MKSRWPQMAKKRADIIDERRPKLVITDLRMPCADGMDLLRHINEEQRETTVIIITAFASVDTAVAAMKAGAYDYISKPIDYDALVAGGASSHGAPEPA